MMLFLENLFQTIAMGGMFYSAYHAVDWFKKEKFIQSIVNVIGFLTFFWWYQVLEIMA
ncbi:hypothetical protein X915_gp134 [Bacillus phage vB_BanS-Tsamsa]|uniref:Uncharacterized protein n=1 Tax=Bacillus phage vB_BanS-Tsamsa TaxID=1308863 RepID=U5J9J4_9CAUD|nr:hypothetical protein X915_gp134 [Bacillus phage vB_BanS-Tsamsa]AGI11962.1 hypothetical protein [Bacillus phage vB_BanS-Tsamsa]